MTGAALAKKFRDLVHAESDGDRSTDRAYPLHGFVNILTISVLCAPGSDQSVPLVIANGVGAHAAGTGHLAGCHVDKVQPGTSSRVKSVNLFGTIPWQSRNSRFTSLAELQTPRSP